MLPLKLVSALVSGENFTNNPLFLGQAHHDCLDDSEENNPTSSGISTQSRNRIPLMLFVPTQELVKDTIRLAAVTRAIGMDLHPNPSLSHIIFSWPSVQSCPPSSSSSSSSSVSSSSSSSSSSYLCTWSLPDGSVPLPFPSFKTASLSHLRLFANLSKGYFKLVFLRNNGNPLETMESLSNYNWNCTSLSLFCTRTGEKIESMDGLSKALLGMGWTLFRTSSSDKDSQKFLKMPVYLYRRSDVSKIRNSKSKGNGDCGECSRVRELRLPPLDFRNVPLRILQYILLMTDDTFHLA